MKEIPIPGYPQDGTRNPVREPVPYPSRPSYVPSCTSDPEATGPYAPKPSEEPPSGYPSRARESRPGETYGSLRPEPQHPVGHPPEGAAATAGHRLSTSGLGPGEWRPAGPAAPRQNQRNLTAGTRWELYRRITDFIRSPEDPVRYHRENGHVHGTLRFLPWHRQFLRSFERWQRPHLADASNFVPLAFWDPAEGAPEEFARELNPSIPSMPLAPTLRIGQGLERLDFATFTRTLEAHHNAAHNAIGGAMLDPRTSPSVPIFWLLHAFYDNVYATWEELADGEV